MKQGYIQIFTGNGKGKTSAALGTLLRSVGAGYKCLLIQFMKSGFPYSELEALKRFSDLVTVESFGGDEHVIEKRPPTKNEIEETRRRLDLAKEALDESKYDVIILDEVCTAVYFGLFTDDEVIWLFDIKDETTELILTGRYCPMTWVERADLVTEMRQIKHYYAKGVNSRKGIDS